MNDQNNNPIDSTFNREQVRGFYDQHPYPPPVKDLAGYRESWQDENWRHADFHLHWPHKSYREDITILVAGCGTSQAAKYALRHPAARVVGVDFSSTSIQHSEALKQKYNLTNLELHQLAVEDIANLSLDFDKIVCTGVLHHLGDPGAGLLSLRHSLKPGGVINLMVYAPYGRSGIYMLQEYCRRLGLEPTEGEIQDLAGTLMALPREHPLAPLLGQAPDFRTRAGLADALLNPQDRAYSVPRLFDLISSAGLSFSRWIRQAPYLPECGAFADTPHASRLAQLLPQERFAALELLRGTMLRHSVILYRSDRSQDQQEIGFEHEHWRDYIPIRLPKTTIVQKELPAGAAAVLINQNHTYPDIFLPVDKTQLQLYKEIDGQLNIAEIMNSLPSTMNVDQRSEFSRSFFEQLWWHDQVVFDISRHAKVPDSG